MTGISRREVLVSAGALAGTALTMPGARADQSVPRVELRLLETSDLHMFVLDWDYYRAKPDATVGLSKVASLIRKARAERTNTLLFDNGDYLQGSPLGDFIASNPRPTASSPHPIVTVMAALGYDAVGLGNHEFNFGLEFLEASFLGAPFPFVCANVTRAGGGAFLPPTAVLERRVTDTNGAEHALRIGVISFVPPQIMIWDKARLEGKLAAEDIVLAAKRLVPALRTSCDVLVALCHSGIRGGDWVEGEEHAALHLATVPGIDVIMTGHSHRVFPGKDYVTDIPGVDAVAGRLNGIPAVMPGFWGSHLGVVDLTLARRDGEWRVEQARVETRPISRRTAGAVEPLAEADAAIVAAIAPAHKGTLAWVEQPAGRIDTAVHSYFAWTGHDPATALVNAAQTAYVRNLIAGTALDRLPLLSAAAPFRVGYTPDSFIDIAAGPAALRQVADLYLYSSNTVVVVKVTGAELREWLEYAARVFNRLDVSAAGPAATPAPLVDLRIPSYNFDIVSGVTYKIDITQPSRYADGTIIESARRIVDLRYQGIPVEPGDEYLVITNNYRADGGGGVPALKSTKVVLRAPDTNRDVVLAYFRAAETVLVPTTFPWRFAETGGGALVYFDTGLAAAAHLPGFPKLAATSGAGPGYMRMTMPID